MQAEALCIQPAMDHSIHFRVQKPRKDRIYETISRAAVI